MSQLNNFLSDSTQLGMYSKSDFAGFGQSKIRQQAQDNSKRYPMIEKIGQSRKVHSTYPLELLSQDNQNKTMREQFRSKAAKHMENESYRKAIECALESIRYGERLSSQSRVEFLPDHLLLAKAYSILGETAECKFYLESASKMAKYKPYQDPMKNAALYSKLADIYIGIGCANEAELLYNLYCTRVESTFGIDHIATSDCYNQIASFYTHRGKYARALDYGSKSLTIRISLLGHHHKFTADAHYNLGLLHRLNGSPKDAKREFQFAYDIRSRLFGKDSIPVAEVAISIGFTEHQLDNLKRAKRYYENAFLIRTSHLGDSHPDTIEALNLLNTVLKSLGREPYQFDPSNMKLNNIFEKQSKSNNGIPLSEPSFPGAYSKSQLMEAINSVNGRGKIMIDTSLESEILSFVNENGPLSPLQLRARFAGNNSSGIRSLVHELDAIQFGNPPGHRLKPGYSPLKKGNGGTNQPHFFTFEGLDVEEKDSESVYDVDATLSQLKASMDIINAQSVLANGTEIISSEISASILNAARKMGSKTFRIGDVFKLMQNNEQQKVLLSIGHQIERHQNMKTIDMNKDARNGVGNGGTGDGGSGFGEKGNGETGTEGNGFGNRGNGRGVDGNGIGGKGGNDETGAAGIGSGNRGNGNGVGGNGNASDVGGNGIGRMNHQQSATENIVLSEQHSTRPMPDGMRTKQVGLSGEELWKLFDKRIGVLGILPYLISQQRAKIESEERYQLKLEKQKQLQEQRQMQEQKQPQPTKQKVVQKTVPVKKVPKGPKSDLKRLHWDVLDDTTGTIWDGVEIDLSMDDVFGDLKDEFSSKPSKEEAKKDAAPEKPKEIILVPDPKRRQNMSIFAKTLTKGSRTLDQVVELLNNMDGDAIGANALGSFVEFVPETDEIEMVQEYVDNGGDLKLLGPAERFILSLTKVKRLKARITSLKFKSSFDEAVRDLEAQTDTVLHTTAHINGSKRLAKLLAVVLKIGNELNKGTYKGGATGIKLSSLMKLTQTKTKRNVTLLEYLIKNLWDKEPEMLNFGDDMPELDAAAKCNMQTMNGELGKLRIGVRQIGNTVKVAAEDPQYVEAMGDFLDRGQVIFETLEQKFQKMREEYGSLCKYFGEDPQKMAPDDFFGIFRNFLNVFNASKKKISEAKERQERQKKRDEHKRAMLEKAKHK